MQYVRRILPRRQTLPPPRLRRPLDLRYDPSSQDCPSEIKSVCHEFPSFVLSHLEHSAYRREDDYREDRDDYARPGIEGGYDRLHLDCTRWQRVYDMS